MTPYLLGDTEAMVHYLIDVNRSRLLSPLFKVIVASTSTDSVAITFSNPVLFAERWAQGNRRGE